MFYYKRVRNSSFQFPPIPPVLGAGHSAGAHTVVALLKTEGCGAFKALVLLDPVDGADPMGIIPEYCITPGELLNFALPTLHLAAGFDPVPGKG